jgi:hypothetical protein
VTSTAAARAMFKTMMVVMVGLLFGLQETG